jgi:thiazole/oxazole-forming peptide maturase SagD family component
MIKSVAAQMPGYHKVLLRADMEMQYHLSGYGTFYEEALIRLAGEVIERYSLMVCQYTLADKIRYACYNAMAKHGRVVPFEFLSVFTDADYAKLNQGQYRGLRRLTPDDVVGWVKCLSLFDPSAEIWVPAQMPFVGYRFSPEKGEVAFCPGFSTGTAAHTSLEEALRSALLEFIEIDALMMHWYTDLKAPRVTPDNLTVASLVPKLLAGDSRHEVLALDLRVLEGVDAHVFGSVLINKLEERPFIVFGAQGDLDPVRAFYRSLMEAIAIAFLGIYGPLYLPNEYLADAGTTSFTDLDRNVAFFASPENARKKRSIIEELVDGRTVLSGMKSYASGNAQTDVGRLIKQLSSVSKYGVFLDVTPPETRNYGWKVMRVFLPELVTMCVPGVPYGAHPRFQAYGGIRNEYPHPLP